MVQLISIVVAPLSLHAGRLQADSLVGLVRSTGYGVGRHVAAGLVSAIGRAGVRLLQIRARRLEYTQTGLYADWNIRRLEYAQTGIYADMLRLPPAPHQRQALNINANIKPLRPSPSDFAPTLLHPSFEHLVIIYPALHCA